MNTNKEIGKRIRKRRLEIGMTQQELTEKMGFKSRSSINKIEIGGRRINPERLEDFAKALNTSVEYLMGLDEKVDIQIDIEQNELDNFKKKLLEFATKLNDDNKKDLEKYLEFLLEKQDN